MKKQQEEEAKKKKQEIKTRSVTSDTSTNTGLASQIVNYALKFVGNPYVYGGNSLTNGTDCSGFTSLVFQNFGISLPRTAASQAYVGRGVSISDIQPGDLVLHGYDGVVIHAALYIGNNQVVHALNSNTGSYNSAFGYKALSSGSDSNNSVESNYLCHFRRLHGYNRGGDSLGRNKSVASCLLSASN